MKEDDLISIIILFGILPVTIMLILFFIHKAMHNERMKLIDKGIDISTIKRKESPFQDVLLWGMLAGGIGFGLLIAYILLETNVFRDDMILGILAILFGGVGLMTFYFIRKPADKK
jgi:hypothetical protein